MPPSSSFLVETTPGRSGPDDGGCGPECRWLCPYLAKNHRDADSRHDLGACILVEKREKGGLPMPTEPQVAERGDINNEIPSQLPPFRAQPLPDITPDSWGVC